LARNTRHLIRLEFGDGRSGMASTAALRAARRDLAFINAKQVVVDGTCAHLGSLAATVQEKVSALVRSGQFFGRYVYDAFSNLSPRLVAFSARRRRCLLESPRTAPPRSRSG